MNQNLLTIDISSMGYLDDGYFFIGVIDFINDSIIA